MDNILGILWEKFRAVLIDIALGRLEAMYKSLNSKVAEVGAEIAKTPQQWNPTVFNTLKDLSETAILPVAGMILTAILCYELVSMMTDRNNMHDFDVSTLYKWIIKSVIAIYLLSNTFQITNAIFEISSFAVIKGSELLGDNTSINILDSMENIKKLLEEMTVGGIIIFSLETILISLVAMVLGVCIEIALLGRIIEIFMYISVAPIPFATMVNRDWGTMGTNYIRGLLALAMQAFFILVCLTIYIALINNMGEVEDLKMWLLKSIGYSFLLVLTIFKSGTISKSIFNAH